MLRLDHVAIATSDHTPVVSALVGELGGLVLSGGTPPRSGFRAMQIRLGRGFEGMTVEVLEPHQPEHDDFLVRFLDTVGEGVHHVTFKTDDVRAERGRLRELGIEPVGVDFEGSWKEMFIHPRDAHGTVVQVAQSTWTPPRMDRWLAGLPESVQIFDGDGPWWSEPAVSDDVAATLDRMVVRTPDLTSAHLFYGSVLGGATDGDTITWEGGEIRLEDGPGRAHVSRLEISGAPTTIIADVPFMSTSARAEG